MSRVLIVMSAADTWTRTDGSKYPTGYWAEEVAAPHERLVAAGFDVDFASPGRGAAADIMDTGLALQLTQSLAALDRQLGAVGDALATRIEEHADTVMAARNHAQQAVPTTYGATLAGLLAQLARHRERLAQATPRIACVSLFGAGGTAAATGA